MNNNFYTGMALILLNVALGLGTFIQILDTSIANVAIPYIAGTLAVSPDEGTWVITSFAASNAIVLPLTGWLSNFFGRVRLFVYSVLLFSLTSFLCGLATSLTMLVIFRTLQGAVAGSLIPLSQSLLILNNPPESRGSALGFWAMIVVVAPVVGPILGGYISEVYSWPWIFYINVPIGIFCAIVTWYFLKDRESTIVRDPIDWIGLFFLAVGVGSLQIMLDKGKDLDWFESNVIIALTITSAIATAYFIVWTLFQKYPIVDFSFFADRNFTLGTIVITVGFLFYFGSTVIVPLWLQTEQNYTAYWAGVAVAPIGIFPVLFSPFVGKYLSRFDLRVASSLSFILFAIGFYWQSLFVTEVNLTTIMLVRLVQGLGVAIFFIPLVQLSLANIPPAKYASAAGLFNFIRILVGSGFGTSLSIELWTRLSIYHHARLAEITTLYDPPIRELYIDAARNANFSNPHLIDRLLNQAIDQQAYMLSTNDISWLAVVGFLMMIPIPFFCKKVNPTQATPGGAH